MKVLIVALNSKFIHLSLGPWYLKANCTCPDVDIKILETTINDNMELLLSEIVNEKPDVVTFSCYIWNINHVHNLVNNVKKIIPNTTIILGGPEVSYNPEEVMKTNKNIDYIIVGEGEEVFNSLLYKISNGSNKENELDIPGLVYRGRGEILKSKGFNLIKDLDSLCSPYTEEMKGEIKNKIVYFESSRGCPFSCSYCISSTFEGVRYFSLERVKQEIDKLLKLNLSQIKFVDRTFNCSKKRAKEIFRYIISKSVETNFHFEVAADLFDDEMLNILKDAPKGMIQFEIGIQTTNTHTLDKIDRTTNMEFAVQNIKKLIESKNIHIHLDLIAGLPMEDFNSFKKSFNDVYSLNPEQLQLGFLKLLKGSKIRREANIHGYKYRDYAPYEILENDYITFDEITILKGIEDLVEKFYNSRRLNKTLNYITNKLFKTPFEMYSEFYKYMVENNYIKIGISNKNLYTVFCTFIKEFLKSSEEFAIIQDLIKFDYLSFDKSKNLPNGIERIYKNSLKEEVFEFLKEPKNIKEFLPSFCNVSPKEIYKRIHVEIFSYDISNYTEELEIKKNESIILFDYSEKDKITELYNSSKIKL